MSLWIESMDWNYVFGQWGRGGGSENRFTVILWIESKEWVYGLSVWIESMAWVYGLSLWIESMDRVHRLSLWIESMDLVYGEEGEVQKIQEKWF